MEQRYTGAPPCCRDLVRAWSANAPSLPTPPLITHDIRTLARDSRVSLVIALRGEPYIKAAPASAMLLVQVAGAIRWHFDPETSMRVCQHVPELGCEGTCHANHHACMTPSSPSPYAESSWQIRHPLAVTPGNQPCIQRSLRYQSQ